jgi:hypothetical protein
MGNRWETKIVSCTNCIKIEEELSWYNQPRLQYMKYNTGSGPPKHNHYALAEETHPDTKAMSTTY